VKRELHFETNQFATARFTGSDKVTKEDVERFLWWWKHKFEQLENKISDGWKDSGIATHGLIQEWRILWEPSAFFYEYAARASLINYKGPYPELEEQDRNRLFKLHGIIGGGLDVGACERFIKADFNASPQELASHFRNDKLITKSPRKKAEPWSVIEAMDLVFFKLNGELSDSVRGQKSKIHRDAKVVLDRIEKLGFSSLLP